MFGIRIAPYLPISDNDELRIEYILAQARSGPIQILEFRLWSEENRIIFRVPDAEGTKPDRGQREFAGLHPRYAPQLPAMHR